MRTDGSTIGKGARRGHAREGILVALALLAMGVVGFSLSTGGSGDEEQKAAVSGASPILEGTLVVENSARPDSAANASPVKRVAPVRDEAGYREALRLSPNDVPSLNGLARILLAGGRPGEALRLALRASALDGESAESRRLAGRAYHTLGMAPEARASYEAAIRLDPSDAWALNNLGLLAIEEERSGAALAPLALAARLAPGEPRIHNNLGVALERTGHVYAAADAYAEALSADSTFAKAAENLARVRPLREAPGLVGLDLDRLAADLLRSLTGAPSVATAAPESPEAEQAADSDDEEVEVTREPR